jgi:hypothetical protein
MNHIASLFLAAFGATCIYAGYRLFCGLPLLSAGERGVSRARVLLLNVIPGALLALLGTALITTEARAMMPHRAGVERYQPPTEGTSWHPAAPHRMGRAA